MPTNQKLRPSHAKRRWRIRVAAHFWLQNCLQLERSEAWETPRTGRARELYTYNMFFQGAGGTHL